MLLFRPLAMLLVLSPAIGASDPFIGTWRLDIDKSDLGGSANVQSGTTTYAPAENGYVYDAEITFGNSKVARLHGPVQFDGTVNEARLDGRLVNFVCERIDTNSYGLKIRDEQTGVTTNIFHYTVQGDTLTFKWLTGKGEPELILEYKRE